MVFLSRILAVDKDEPAGGEEERDDYAADDNHLASGLVSNASKIAFVFACSFSR